MIKLSKLTDYAVVILAEMARGKTGRILAASSLSEQTGLPEPTVSKVLKMLSKGGVIRSERGANGGYILGDSPAEIKIMRVIGVMDGPLAIASCVDECGDVCDYHEKCPVKGKWAPVNLAIRGALEHVTLADMVE